MLWPRAPACGIQGLLGGQRRAGSHPAGAPDAVSANLDHAERQGIFHGRVGQFTGDGRPAEGGLGMGVEDLVHPAEKMAVSGVDVGRGFNGDPVAVDGERTGGLVSLACIKVFAVAKNRGCHGIPTVRTPHLYLPDTV